MTTPDLTPRKPKRSVPGCLYLASCGCRAPTSSMFATRDSAVAFVRRESVDGRCRNGCGLAIRVLRYVADRYVTGARR